MGCYWGREKEEALPMGKLLEVSLEAVTWPSMAPTTSVTPFAWKGRLVTPGGAAEVGSYSLPVV